MLLPAVWQRFRSAFRHSVTGFGGRIAALGGSLLGGEIGSTVQKVGLLAQWDRSSIRGSTNDKRLVVASQDVAGEFVQCRRCAEWVGRGVCWDDAAGSCARCVPSPLPYDAPQSYALQSYAPQSYAPQSYAPQPFGPQSACSGCGAPSQGTAFWMSCGTRAG